MEETEEFARSIENVFIDPFTLATQKKQGIFSTLFISETTFGKFSLKNFVFHITLNLTLHYKLE
jgi:hypothetical protein